MIGHLGPRVSALLDGQLPATEEERAWSHVQHCATCHDEVRRQGWVKTRLAGLSSGPAAPADEAWDIKTALLAAGPPPSGDELLAMSAARPVAHRTPRHRGGFNAIGAGAAGAVALGMLAVVAPPADAPVTDRRPPPSVRPLDAARTAGVVPTRTGVRP